MTDPNENPWALLPEILLLLGAAGGLLLGLWLPRRRQWLVRVAAAAVLVAALIAAIVAMLGERRWSSTTPTRPTSPRTSPAWW